MVEATLTNELIRNGEKLVRELDKSDLTINAALWFYFSDVSAWRLMLGIEEAEELGPKSTYRKIQSVLHKLRETKAGYTISLDEIAVAKPEAPLLELLRMAVHTGKGIGGMRFSNNVINGHLIEDAYIYRMT